MSVKQELNVLSQMRVDVPHLRSINSSVIKDFGLLMEAFANQTPYILKGFTIPTNTAIGGPASAIQVVVDDSILWMPTDIKGSYLNVPAGTANEILSNSNSKVSGSFTPNTTNYLSVRLIKPTDSSTADLVAFIDIDSGVEFTKTVPTGLVLTYEFVVTTGGFGTNTPIAKIVTNAANGVVSVENCKQSLFRLATGGDNPDVNHEHSYSDPEENLLTATSTSDPNPFEGGDWEIGTFKEWMDAVMTEIKKIKGSATWYSDGSSALDGVNLLDLYNDAIGSVATGRGKFINSGGTFSWTSDVYIKSLIGPRVYTIPTNSVVIADGQVAYITLDRNNDFHSVNTFTFTSGSNQVFTSIPVLNLNAGDWIRAVGDNEAAWRKVQSIAPSGGGSLITLTSNYPNNGSAVKALKSVGSYTVSVANPEDVPATSDTYWIAKRSDETFASSAISAIERSSDVVTVTHAAVSDLAVGQNVLISGVTSDTTLNASTTITSVINSTQFTYDQSGPDSGPYAEGTVSAPAKIYIRWLGELGDGESSEFDDNVPAEVLQYMGSPSESSSAPLYLDVPAGSLNNPDYNTIAGENLTTRLSKVTAMLSDGWQDDNSAFNPGTIVFDGSNISITGAYISIPGDTVGAADVLINDVSNQALADGEALYVDISRSNGAALTLSVDAIEDLDPAAQRLILYRRIGSEILTKPTSLYRLQTAVTYVADYADPISTSLPTGASVVIDGVAGVDGDTVLFTNLSSGNNQVYALSGVGSSIVWSALPIFNGGSYSPENGAEIKILKGLGYADQKGIFSSTYWSFNDVVRHFNTGGDYYEVTSLRKVSIPASSTGTILSIQALGSENLIVDYSIVRDTNKETGTYIITNNGATASGSANSSAIGTVGISFTADINASNVRLLYTSDGSGPTATLQYSVKRWSDVAGGPAGLPVYSPVTTLPTSVVDTAYCMSDGSSTEVNCSTPTVVSSRTTLQLNFTYTPTLLPGTTSGDLEVYVDGKFLPRFVSGVTVDAYYREVDNQTIDFNRDYSLIPVSIEVRKKYGSIDTSNANSQKLAAWYSAVVGSSAQVLAGAATHTSINAAISTVSSGQAILVLPGAYTENVTVDKTVYIEGQGYGSAVNGTVTYINGTQHAMIKALNATQFIFLASSSNNILDASFWTISPVDMGTNNKIINLSSVDYLPAGTILDFGGSAPPAGYLLCDGSAVSRTLYSNLFAAIGTIWGVGDGSTTFNVPLLTRRATIGSGGTQEHAQAPGTTVGSQGGYETHTQTPAEAAMPIHYHGFGTNGDNTGLFGYKTGVTTAYAPTGAVSRGWNGNGGSPGNAAWTDSQNSVTSIPIMDNSNTHSTDAIFKAQDAMLFMQPSAVVTKMIKY